MKILGIALQKGQLRYSLLDGTKIKPNLILKEKLNTIALDNVPELMDWFETNFLDIIEKHKPDKVCYKITLGPKKEQLFSLIMPLGVLNLICKKKRITVVDYNKLQFTQKKLGLDKSVDLYKKCDEIFGTNPPYWDITQKDSIIVGWLEL